MQRRRKRRLLTRTLNKEHALLDDLSAGQVQVSAAHTDSCRRADDRRMTENNLIKSHIFIQHQVLVYRICAEPTIRESEAPIITLRMVPALPIAAPLPRTIEADLTMART